MARAGEWSCDPARQFHLVVRDVASSQIGEPQRRWIDSLTEALRQRGGNISHVNVFVRSTAGLTLNGEPTDCPVFQGEETPPRLFYIGCEDLIVDFSAQEVLSPGVAGQSRHISPSASVAALVHSKGTRIVGVPVGGCLVPPLFFWNPWFRESEVWWY